ncbi:hypothetical protein [Providencia rettgeri]|uniref:hypothetical protein n=1 Tax=Providencia rettgeri TaxID=587 RepID=UPI0023605314|nr:hypothetical protein [Providencia rettgeri]
MAKGWSIPPSNFAHLVSDDVGTEMKRTAGAMLQAVIFGSPVDKGTFRGNHRVTEGVADRGYDVSQADKSGNETLQLGVSTIVNSKPFTTLYIQNNLPYSISLEQGHSGQAPRGVYSIAFETVLLNRR